MRKENRMKRGFLYLLLLTGFIGCSDQEEPDKHPSATEVQVALSLKVDPMLTRAGGDISDRIENLEILVLEKEQEEEEDQFRYTYRITPQKVTKNGENEYTLSLRATDASVKLLLLANNTNFTNLTLRSSAEEIKEKLLQPFTGEELQILPMYGELTFPTGIMEENSIRNIPLLRSVAGVDITTAPSLAGIFELKTVQAYRANNQIQVIPNPLVFTVPAEDQGWKVTAPSVPQTAENIITVGSLTNQTPGRIYLPESEKTDTGATCLIIGGLYQNNTTVTYYRIDFGNTQEEIGEIRRNHLYTFLIKDVTGPGTTHPEDADGNDIETTIYDWEDSNHNIDL